MDWSRLKQLFTRAATLPADQRLALVASLDGEATLQRELARLLRADRESDGFLDCPSRSPGFSGTDRYRVGARLGRGPLAAVYSGRDAAFGTPVALKVFDRPEALRRSALRELASGFEALARVRHPNLVKLRAFVEDAPVRFAVMDLVNGIDLESFLATTSAGDSLDQLVDGVEAIHAAGRVHGGLRSTNVLVDSTGRIRILDLGTSRASLGRELTDSDPGADWRSISHMLETAVAGGAPTALLEVADRFGSHR